MSLLDLFTSGEHKKARTFFAALIKIAFADGSMDKKELKFLEKMAFKLDISDAEFTKILEHPDEYPLETPLDYDERIEQLYNLTRMIASDEEIKLNEALLVRKLAIGLGFPVDNAEKITDEAIFLILNDNSLKDFNAAIREVNKF
jgi:uncharacterized tellurite resistance protein B-like protein